MMVSMRCWMHPITTMQNHFIRTQEKQHNFQDNYIIFMIFQVLEKNTFFRNPGFSFETPSFLRGPTFSWDPEASGRYMVGGFKHFWNFPSFPLTNSNIFQRGRSTTNHQPRRCASGAMASQRLGLLFFHAVAVSSEALTEKTWM